MAARPSQFILYLLYLCSAGALCQGSLCAGADCEGAISNGSLVGSENRQISCSKFGCFFCLWYKPGTDQGLTCMYSSFCFNSGMAGNIWNSCHVLWLWLLRSITWYSFCYLIGWVSECFRVGMTVFCFCKSSLKYLSQWSSVDWMLEESKCKGAMNIVSITELKTNYMYILGLYFAFSAQLEAKNQESVNVNTILQQWGECIRYFIMAK